MHRCSLLLVLLGSVMLTSCFSPTERPAGPLIVISIDGFRWDYLEKYDAPVLRRLARDGTHVQRLVPSFPSKTFPNHYTLVTGLRPGRHGIVGNWFYDPADNAKFDMSKTEPRWWNGGEPVWITAEKQGLRSACFFWPGAETELQGRRPSLFKPYEEKLTPNDRVNGVLAWLALPPGERPRFCTLYFDHLDTTGHAFGPDAPETGAAVKEADAAIAQLLAGLDELGLRGSANLVIVSDHGMSPTSVDRVVFIEDLMDVSRVRIEAIGTYAGVRPIPGVEIDDLFATIRAKAPATVQVYRREDLPERFHYSRNERIPPILLLTDDGWSLESKTGWPAQRARFSKGNHGWDPATLNMGALFIASGPAFRRGKIIPDVENIHVYNLLCAVLGLSPAPNDGDDRLVRQALAR
jgi:predicted AlkP superfamily pyrophosphatase or phosphodiesterase